MAFSIRLLPALGLAWLSAVAWGSVPRHTIDQVEHAASKAGVGRLVGIDFTGRAWDVYHVQDGRVMELRISDRTLTVQGRSAQPHRLPDRHLPFRDALAAVRRATQGTVLSLELERDPEKGLVWSGLVRQGNYVSEVYLHGVTGRVIEVQRMRRPPQ